MDRDRATALSHFLRFLSGNPGGDAAVRALTTGVLALLDVTIAQVYAISKEDTATLELVGSFGFDDEEAAAYRALPTGLPVPVCEAFITMNAVVVRAMDVPTRYPILATEPTYTLGTLSSNPDAYVICVPIFNSGIPIGVIDMVQETDRDWETGEWQYLDGVSAAVGLWMNNQRQILVERWRRSAPAPLREVRVSERQRQILELIGEDRTNNEIARSLGYSVPTIKKDLQQIMRVLGTEDRRATAGRAREIGLLPERRQRD
jgi:DNA-binding CsgD family transcriptional regulator